MTTFGEPPWREEARRRAAEDKRIRQMLDTLAEKVREVERLRSEVLAAINALRDDQSR